MFFRAARYYLRMEWLRIAAAVLAFILFAVLMVNTMGNTPLTYEAFMSTYGGTIWGGAMTPDRLARHENIPRELLGDKLEDCYPAIREHHFTRFVGSVIDVVNNVAPILAGALAALFLCPIFRRRRLGPIMASGFPRGALYLFLAVLYFLIFLLFWLILVPLCFSRYQLPLRPEQLYCLELLRPSLLLALLFGAAVSFFFAFLLRRAVPVFLASAGALYLIRYLGGPVPLPAAFIRSLYAWQGDTPTDALLMQGCVTAAVILAALIGGWLCFRRQEQE